MRNFIHHPKYFFKGILLAVTIIIADLYSKYFIFNLIDQKNLHYIKITNFLNLVKVHNTGVSFGMFNNLEHGVIILSTSALIITAILLIWLAKIYKKSLAIALGLIIGGALGNIIDRIINGAVADFIDVYFKHYHWPAFNLADSAIAIGAIILIIDEFKSDKTRKKIDNINN